MTDHPWFKEVINLVHKRLSPPWEEHARVTIIKPCLSRLRPREVGGEVSAEKRASWIMLLSDGENLCPQHKGIL